jgi:hypothetical protein
MKKIILPLFLLLALTGKAQMKAEKYFHPEKRNESIGCGRLFYPKR